MFGIFWCVVIGWDSVCFFMILVVLEVCCGVWFFQYDVYLNVVGGLKINEFGVDFVVVVVLVFLFSGFVFLVNCVYFGEISLLGVIWLVVQVQFRLKEVEKFGFDQVYCLEGNFKDGVGLSFKVIGLLEFGDFIVKFLVEVGVVMVVDV